VVVALTACHPRDPTGAVQEPSARPPAPRDAAAVILARDAPGGLEVLLLQRHPDSRFSPGAFAFPGGRVEPADAAPGVETRCRGLGRADAARELTDIQPPERAIGFWVAALREAFEEAGILLAHGPDGRPVDAAALGDVRAHRARCRADSAVFGYLLAELALTLATDQVAYWAHWITPEERPIRYDTRFFVAEARQDHRPEPDGLETVAARWVAPGDALAGHRARELVLPFPTQRILASLAEHRDVGALLAAARGREIRPVRPRIVRDASGERILLPQDPGWY
jgi:8-oxo-dGTP pyrophosphatase MutT (NUDIX family)